MDRDVYAVLDDVQQEKLSVDHVRREYGVVIDPDKLELDLESTELLRAELREKNPGNGD